MIHFVFSVLMEEVDLPSVFVKKELGLKRSANEAGLNNTEIDKHAKMIRKQEGEQHFGSTPGGKFLFKISFKSSLLGLIYIGITKK